MSDEVLNENEEQEETVESTEPVESEEERLQREEQERLAREEQERLQREQEERERAEEARLRSIQEHEEYLNSFPETTVFYRDLLVKDNVKSLGTVVRDPHIAEQWGFLDNHFDESELTYVGTPECGIWYLKGYEKPEPTEEEKMLAHKAKIEAQLDAHLLDLAKSRGYDDCKSLATYFNSTKERFRKDAIAFVRYRDDVYDVGYDIIDKCISGEIDYRVVTLEYILNLVDPIDW